MKYELTIQEKLKDLRVENGLSLEQLADATGISKSALSSYEVVENREISSFVKKLCPDDYNLQAETLKRISIEEDAFFEHTLSEDIVRIMREIRARHLGDIESKADTSIVDRMVATVDEVAGFKGTPLKKFKLIFHKWFGAKDIKLTDNADEQLESALNSELLKPVTSDKKKKHR